MLLCEGKLKVNSVNFRLPSAAQKQALELAKSLQFCARTNIEYYPTRLADISDNNLVIGSLVL